jgi:hypothetical protein
MVRVLALDDDGNLTALTPDEFEQQSDVEMTLGATLPGLLDAVYLSASGTVDKATSYEDESPCIGFISALLPLNKCLMRREGELDGFLGLVPGDAYYLDASTPGAITNAPDQTNSGKVMQRVGLAITTSKLLVIIDGEWTVL